MKKFWGLLIVACFLISSAFAESILPALNSTDQICYAPAFRSVGAYETPAPSDEGSGKKAYVYDSVSLEAYDAFGLALAQAGYVLNTSEVSNESGNITMNVSCADIELQIIFNPDNEVMKIIYPKGVLPSPDTATDESLIKDASAVKGIFLEIGVEYAPSLSQVSFLTDDNPDTLSNGSMQYDYKPVFPIIYERFSAKLGEEGYSLVSAEQDEESGEQTMIVAKDGIELTLHYNSENNRMKIDYPMRVKPAESDLSEYTASLEIGDTFTTDQSGVTAAITNVTTVDSYTRGYTNSFYLISSRTTTYYAEENNEVFLWVSFQVDNHSADFASRRPYGSLSVKLVTGEAETLYNVEYAGNSSRVGYVSTRSADNEDIAPGTQIDYQCVFEIPRIEFEAADQIRIELITKDYAYKYVVDVEGLTD